MIYVKYNIPFLLIIIIGGNLISEQTKVICKYFSSLTSQRNSHAGIEKASNIKDAYLYSDQQTASNSNNISNIRNKVGSQEILKVQLENIFGSTKNVAYTV